MTNFEIRKKFLSFFIKKQHKVLPGSSLIPNNDPSLLFVNAGMNQFKNIFLGLEQAPEKNVITVQKCLRAGGKHNDLEEVGETSSHNTFFEMLGNFSFGGYFKETAMALAWEFITEELKLDPENLWISIYEKDEESYAIWRDKQKIPENKIYRMGAKDNFWQMGETGPCGPCTEIHYYKGKEKRPNPNQFMEFWNLVFIEFYDTEEGKRQKLSVPCVDTGMGLERLCALLQNKRSIYHTDLFSEIILSLEKASGCKYNFEEKNQTEQQKAFRVLTDHSRAVSFLVSDGVVTGNDKESYVLRRIIRRALYYSQKLHPKKNLLQVGVEKTISLMNKTGLLLKQDKELIPVADNYLSLKQEEGNIQSVIEREAQLFFDSLKRGKKQLEEAMKSLPKKFIPEPIVWNLYSTYGFPTDLTRLMAKEKGWAIATEEEIIQYKRDELERINEKKKKKFIEESKQGLKPLEEMHEKELRFISKIQSKTDKTHFTGYERSREEGQILFIDSVQPLSNIAREGNQSSSTPKLECLQKGEGGWLVLDKSCFYPEGGGPIGDRGFLKTETGRAEVLDCQKKGNFIWHEVSVLKGKLEEDQQCRMEVNTSHRREISASHTATHLLNAALRSVLGESVRQAGSLVETGRLRFDFTYPKALTEKECQQIEELVWQSIEKEENLFSSFKSFEQAKTEGAVFLQGENYDSEVRIISIGEKTSKELCAGIHVKNTKEIKGFKIVSEKGIQAGVRRIVAYTGSLAKAWESFLINQNIELRKYLSLPLPVEKKTNSLFYEKEGHYWEGSVEKQNPFLNGKESKEKELKKLRKQIVRLEEKESPSSLSKDQKFIKVKSRFHPLALQVLELREHLKLPLPKAEKVMSFVLRQGAQDEMFFSEEQEKKKSDNSIQKIEKFDQMEEQQVQREEDFFKESTTPLNCLKIKEQEVKKLKDQMEKIKKLGWTKDSLLAKAKDFKLKDLKGKLLVADFPLEDRKILSDLSDSILLKLSSGLVILSGEGEGKYPVLISLTKNFEKILSAGDILKNTIAPLCKGKGGGKASFAQGSITDKSAFSDLEKILLESWSKL